jgi:hypothetical protein
VTRAAVLLSALALGACRREESKPTPPPLDTVAPVLAVRPAGGAFAETQYLVLAANEPAHIRFTLDGTDPALASASVRVGESPIFWIRIGSGTTVLRAVAIDAAGNVSAPIQETYAVSIPPPPAPPPPPDLQPPTLTLVAAPSGALPILGSSTVEWRSDEPVSWDAWLVATPVQGPQRLVGHGNASGGETVSIPVNGWDLQSSAVIRVVAKDAAGWSATLEVPVSPTALVMGTAVPADGHCYDLAFSPDGARAYFTAGTLVAFLDTAAASATLDTVLATHPLPDGPAMSLAVDPGGARLWVGSGVSNTYPYYGIDSLFSMDAVSGATSVAHGSAQYTDSVAVSPDGSSVFVSSLLTDDVWRLQVDAGGTVTVYVSLPKRTGPTGAGSLALAASGRRLFAGTTVIDADPSSATRDELLGTLPVSTVSSHPAAAPGDGPVYVMHCPGSCFLDAFDPMTLVSVGRATIVAGSVSTGWQLAVTPDGAHVLAMEDSGPSRGLLHVIRASDLVELGGWSLPLVGGTESPLRVSPDATRAYGVWGAYSCQPVRIPLR